MLIGALVIIVAALSGGVLLVLCSAWVAEHNGQIIGVVGLAVLAVLFAIPIVVEFNRHPRHLSGPGRNPGQGAGPWRVE